VPRTRLPRRLRKHMENALPRLDVTSRTAAVTRPGIEAF
jgi:hypothetical protein